jgi:hypothetical protein
MIKFAMAIPRQSGRGDMIKVMMIIVATLALAGGATTAQQVSPNGVRTLSPNRELKCRKNYGAGHLSSRTIIEVHRLNQDDIVEVEGTFLRADHETPQKVTLASANPWSDLPGQGRPISASEHPVAGTRPSPDPPLRVYVLAPPDPCRAGVIFAIPCIPTPGRYVPDLLVAFALWYPLLIIPDAG